MPIRLCLMHGAARGVARLLVAALALGVALASGTAGAGEVPALGLAQEDADGQVALPRITAGMAQDPLVVFELAASASCPASAPRPELVVSIADTTRIVTREGPRQVLAVEVPLGQLQWLAAPTETCDLIDGKRAPERVEESGERIFRLHAVTAAFATLVCSATDGQASAASTATPLDAWLACPGAGSPR